MRDGTRVRSGLVIVAVGIGLSIFLNGVVTDKSVWTVGIIPMLIGLVVFAFSFFQKADRPGSEVGATRSSLFFKNESPGLLVSCSSSTG